MVCAYCNAKTTVTNSRSSKKTKTTWRRRQCTVCSGLFTTRESSDLESSLRVKTSSSGLQPFLRDKLLISIYGSLLHRKSALNDATSLTDTIVSTILGQCRSGLIHRDEIIETAAATLSKFDNLAATHYLAHHRFGG